MSWDTLHKRAKILESALETKIERYSGIAQKFNSSFLVDEESPLVESSDEQVIGSEIERDLSELYDCIQGMRQVNGGILTNQQEAWIKRYYEIHFDYSTEFKNTSVTIQRKRESMDLMRTSAKSEVEQSSAVQKLLKEKMSIASAMRSINEVVSQAFEAKNTLANQRNSINSSNSGLTGISTNIPSIGRIIESIQKKKSRESIVIALVIGTLLSFTIWWTLLR